MGDYEWEVKKGNSSKTSQEKLIIFVSLRRQQLHHLQRSKQDQHDFIIAFISQDQRKTKKKERKHIDEADVLWHQWEIKCFNYDCSE